ncbi:tRNA1(Val) (adenine(37)-N6)-methyltransferase [Ferrovibrio sp.]|uniref:tRNA1(Val) (adenine(37)-N6)-methyltransferase n=1 Tax=Ferrovibrio sp. TaxID=1917215 RepID=UPI003D140929
MTDRESANFSQDTTLDALLGGRVQLKQPRKGQRASADAVMLAAAVPARRGQRVLELGCGTGVAMLCLAARLPGLEIDGIELQPDLVALARGNIAANGQEERLRAFAADLRERRQAGPGVAPNSYDQVFANPPYFDPARHRVAADPGRALARQGRVRGETSPEAETDAAAWIGAMLRYCKPGGRLTLIQRVEQLGALLVALEPKAGGIEVIPLHSKPGQAAKRLILRAVKGGKAPLMLRPGLVLHHPDGSYFPEIDAVLRDGAALPI